MGVIIKAKSFLNVAMSLDVVQKLVQVLERGRNEARFEGNYVAGARDLETVLKGIGKLLITCEKDADIVAKLTELEKKVSIEVQAMRDYHRELRAFETPLEGRGGKGHVFGGDDGDSAGVYDDPDVWKPHTRAGARNSSSSQHQPQENPVGNRRGVPFSQQSRAGVAAGGTPTGANNRIERMRQERDSHNVRGHVGAPGAGARNARVAIKPPLPSRNQAGQGHVQGSKRRCSTTLITWPWNRSWRAATAPTVSGYLVPAQAKRSIVIVLGKKVGWMLDLIV